MITYRLIQDTSSPISQISQCLHTTIIVPVHEFWYSHHSDYEDNWLMEYDDVKAGRNMSPFSIDVLCLPSGW
jgi:hypothetical protein